MSGHCVSAAVRCERLEQPELIGQMPERERIGAKITDGAQEALSSHMASWQGVLEALGNMPRPSRIEVKMHRLKSFGERIAARDTERQTAEIHR